MWTHNFFMMMQSEAPSAADLMPITLQDAKAFLRVQGAQDDMLISSLVAASAELIEQYSMLRFGRREVAFSFDEMRNEFALPVLPFHGLLSISYLDQENNVQEVDVSSYSFVLRNGVPHVFSADVPRVSVKRSRNSVTVRVEAGFDNSEAVPERVKNAARLLVSNAYDNRSTPEIMSAAVKSQLGNYRLRGVA
jgi:uncharacterized phiE125 gp8 family phage protein